MNVKSVFVVSGVFDNGASYRDVNVVIMARNQDEAKGLARRHMEKHSDDYLNVKSVRAMTDSDVFVEGM